MQFGPPRDDITLGTVGRPGNTVRVLSAEDTERALLDAYNALDPKFKVSFACRQLLAVVLHDHPAPHCCHKHA